MHVAISCFKHPQDKNKLIVVNEYQENKDLHLNQLNAMYRVLSHDSTIKNYMTQRQVQYVITSLKTGNLTGLL
jgi:hypothetical protein